MKKEVRLYNVLLPVWLLWIFPQVWLVILPGNLLIDCLVLTGALFVLKHRNKWAVVRKLWWKFWLLGFLADFVGVLWMVVALSIVSNAEANSWWYESLSYAMPKLEREPRASCIPSSKHYRRVHYTSPQHTPPHHNTVYYTREPQSSCFSEINFLS